MKMSTVLLLQYEMHVARSSATCRYSFICTLSLALKNTVQWTVSVWSLLKLWDLDFPLNGLDFQCLWYKCGDTRVTYLAALGRCPSAVYVCWIWARQNFPWTWINSFPKPGLFLAALGLSRLTVCIRVYSCIRFRQDKVSWTCVHFFVEFPNV